MSEIRLEQVAKVFAGDVRAVDGVSLTIASGEFMVLVGPVGVRQVDAAPHDRRARGSHRGRDLDRRPRGVATRAPRPRHRDGLPELRALPPPLGREEPRLRPEGAEDAEGGDRDAAWTRSRACSGSKSSCSAGRVRSRAGQRQRVAMGRAIVREPAAFLMDEPLSNLDAKLRVDMRAELARLHDRLGVTTVYVTHDQVEAMTLGTRVAVMRDGTVQQVDTPQALYRDPANLFVAAFIGSPSMNLVEAEVSEDAVEFAGYRIPLTPERRPAGISSGTVILGIRPQDFEDARTADGGAADDRRRASRSSRSSARRRTCSSRSTRRRSTSTRCGRRPTRRSARRSSPPTSAPSSPPRWPRGRRCARANGSAWRSTRLGSTSSTARRARRSARQSPRRSETTPVWPGGGVDLSTPRG